MRAFLFFLGIVISVPAVAADLRLGSSTVAVGVGGAFAVDGYKTYSFHDGPSFAANYELGLHKYLAAEIGVENFLLPYDNYSRWFTATTRERVTLMPFGLRGTVPVADGRVELFAGTGGAVLWSSEDTLGHPYDGSRLLWQLNAGTRVALGHAKRFRVGPTVRYYRDLGRPTQQWVSLTADFSYRFGR